jgi:hypothetical protein
MVNQMFCAEGAFSLGAVAFLLRELGWEYIGHVMLFSGMFLEERCEWSHVCAIAYCGTHNNKNFVITDLPFKDCLPKV